jgi:hypothetical protein
MAKSRNVSPAGAVLAIGGSVLRFWALLIGGRIHQPRGHVGGRLSFADGSCARVFRETVVDQPRGEDPAVLVVEFRLRAVHGWGHRLFERVSVLNTPLFAGFPGFVSNLWLVRDQNEVYRGIYEWDGAERAADYAQALRWILAMVSVPGSIAHHIAPGETRSEYVAEPEELVDTAVLTDSDSWWRVS